MGRQRLLQFTDRGIFCPAGDFYIDPWKPVDRAVITHGHSDHARSGHRTYLTHTLTAPILRLRLGAKLSVQAAAYNEPVTLGGVKVSLHPAGHIPGSAQIRIERNGEVVVVAGDYKLRPDGLSTAWEPIKCDAFITESTFGLPIYKWPDPADVTAEIHRWWKKNRELGKTSIITAYSLGKAQRVLHLLDRDAGEIFVHPAVRQINRAYTEAGLNLTDFPDWDGISPKNLRTALIVTPPGGAATATKRFGPSSTANASGWMAIRGNRRRLALDRGFVLSDHADWTELNEAVIATGAERIFVTHGQIDPFVRWLRERGHDAHPVRTEFTGDPAEETTLNPGEAP